MLLEMLNGLSELVYIADADNYDLLFLNTAGQQMFGIDNVGHCKCYKALQGKDAPCDFCNNHLLSSDSFYTWKTTNQLVRRHYLLKDKIIEWEGRRARIEIAFDTTDQELQNRVLQNTLEGQTLTLNCVKTLYSNDNLSTSLSQVLELIGDFLGADRTYIFQFCEKGMSCGHEWCANGISSQSIEHNNMQSHMPEYWHQLLSQHQCLIIDEAEVAKSGDNKICQILKDSNVHYAIIAPLRADGKLIGYLGTDNPSSENMDNTKLQLETLGYFISLSLQRQEDKILLETLSYRDTLTDTLNRNAYVRDLERMIFSSNQSIGVVHLDVNGMKEINDVFGHPYGDQVLLKAAQIVQSVFNMDESYRIGGDEFIIISQNISAASFETRIADLRSAFPKDADFHVSFGYQWVAHCDDIEKVIFDADEMLYDEKKKFYRRQAMPKRYRHENDDVLGLTKPNAVRDLLESGNFPIHFQPKFSIKDLSLIGAEALVRYISPEGILIAPNQFIPILEETRIISQVDFHVFEHACKTISRWIASGQTPTPISVNFSRYSLPQKQFPQQLNQIWEKYKIPKTLIEIEITESMDEYDNQHFLSVVEDISKSGFTIAIDDFGVKYANLSVFTTLQFDVLKIDKIFAEDLENNPASQIILKSISDVCRKMGIHMIVEGVETEEQLHVLRELGCEWAQGYLFDKPIPLDQFEEKYINGQIR